MQDVANHTGKNSISQEPETAPAERNLFVAVGVGATVLAIVMLLMMFAVLRASSPLIGHSQPQSEEVRPADRAVPVVVEETTAWPATSMHGARELVIRGVVRNSLHSPIKAADMRCYFKTASGGETPFEFPLIVDTRLDEVGAGRLLPFSAREFGVRIGEFPNRSRPTVSRIEVVNVCVQSL
jgi:hypothetical protein